MKKSQLALASLAIALFGMGCTNSGDDSVANNPAGQGIAGSGAAGAGEVPEAKCPADTPTFLAGQTNGLEAMGEMQAVKGRIVAADHTPPQKYKNTWTVALTDPTTGAPLTDAQVVSACSWMSVHRHGSAPLGDPDNMVPGVTPGPNPGEFNLNNLNLFMPGPWEVQLAVKSDSIPTANARVPDCPNAVGGQDFVLFNVCVMDQ